MSWRVDVMIVFYNKDTLAWTHVAHTYGEDYLTFIRSGACTESFVEVDSNIPVERIHIEKNGDHVIVREKLDMSTSVSVDKVHVGQEFSVRGVPEGSSVYLDDALIGVMDSSGVLEITASVAGKHNFVFTLPGFMDGRATVEVVSDT